MKQLLITATALVTVIACSDAVGEVIHDAGVILADAGDAMVPDAGADVSVACNADTGIAEFDVPRPGETRVTLCYRASGSNPRAYCTNFVAWWYEGTKRGFINCIADTKSITVHE